MPRLPGGEDKRRSREPAYAILLRHTARRQGAGGVRGEPGRELLQAASRHAIQRSPGRVEEALEGRGARDPRSSVSPVSRTSRVQNSAFASSATSWSRSGPAPGGLTAGSLLHTLSTVGSPWPAVRAGIPQDQGLAARFLGEPGNVGPTCSGHLRSHCRRHSDLCPAHDHGHGRGERRRPGTTGRRADPFISAPSPSRSSSR
jgi:hypothetical protein